MGIGRGLSGSGLVRVDVGGLLVAMVVIGSVGILDIVAKSVLYL